MIETTKTVTKAAMAAGTLTAVDVEGNLCHEDRQLQQFHKVFEQEVGDYILRDVHVQHACSLHLAEEARAYIWIHLTGVWPLEGLETTDVAEFNLIGIALLKTCKHCQDPVNGEAFSVLVIPGGLVVHSTSGHNTMTRIPYVGS